ncbi:MAG TPA: ATP-binding protein [Pseudolabrys sp.]|nr:ATP-binding protein [Pseudolabrys sp.]
MAVRSDSPEAKHDRRQEGAWEIQRAMLNILEDSDEERKRLQSVQTATLNILEDFSQERNRSAQMQTATLNILEDFDAERSKYAEVQTATLNILEDFIEERNRSAQMQTATLNILEDFDAEKSRLEQSQRAYLNILEDIDIERDKVAIAYKRVEAINAELQEFAYAASHDLKAPLRVIDNASKWLEEDLQEHLTDETRENMKLLRGRVRRMENLLDDLLEYSRIGRVTDERFAEIISGSALMENVLMLLSPQKQFTVEVDPAMAGVRVARMPLQQILMNLVGNAIKHHDKSTGRIEVSATDEGAFYRFAVKDDGPGIAPEFHEQIFKMFQTLRPRDQVEGSGMGLAMVRKNIETFGGTLNLQSSPGDGSIFSFTWPKRQRLGRTGV